MRNTSRDKDCLYRRLSVNDGVDHINVYSKGETELGRALSNFSAHTVHTLDGRFASIEGYWYWLGVAPANPRRAALMHVHGWEAKRLGRELRAADWNSDPTFKLRIISAMVSKLMLYPSILEPFRASTLPFRHYYVYGGKPIEPAEGRWIIDTWEHLRRVIKQ